MTLITGNIVPNVVEFPILGRPGVIVQLLNSSGVAVPITNDVTVTADIYRDITDTAALISRTSGAGDITVLNETGYIFVSLSAANALLLSSQWLYDLTVKLLDAVDPTIIKQFNAFKLLPVNSPQAWTKPVEVGMALSTQFLNTQRLLGENGGTGYLDGISTVAQPVGCQLQFTITGDINTPPAEWELQVWTNQVNTAGAWRLPLDFNASTNAKVWRKIS